MQGLCPALSTPRYHSTKHTLDLWSTSPCCWDHIPLNPLHTSGFQELRGRNEAVYFQQENLLCQRSLLRTPQSLSQWLWESSGLCHRTKLCPLTVSLQPQAHSSSQPCFLTRSPQPGRKANTENFPRWLQQLEEPTRDNELKIPNTNRMIYLDKNINTDELIFPKPS